MSRRSRTEAIARALLPYAFFVTVVSYAARERLTSRDEAEPKMAYAPAAAVAPMAPIGGAPSTTPPDDAGVAPEPQDAATGAR